MPLLSCNIYITYVTYTLHYIFLKSIKKTLKSKE
ncbi:MULTISPECIES: DUF1563 domain-containing protein [Sporosarcina]